MERAAASTSWRLLSLTPREVSLLSTRDTVETSSPVCCAISFNRGAILFVFLDPYCIPTARGLTTEFLSRLTHLNSTRRPLDCPARAVFFGRFATLSIRVGEIFNRE